MHRAKNTEVLHLCELDWPPAADAKEYFKALSFHRKYFEHAGDDDDRNIDMVFSKTKADDRKMWMAQYTEGDYLDHAVDTITFSDFINKVFLQPWERSRSFFARVIPCHMYIYIPRCFLARLLSVQREPDS